MKLKNTKPGSGKKQEDQRKRMECPIQITAKYETFITAFKKWHKQISKGRA